MGYNTLVELLRVRANDNGNDFFAEEILTGRKITYKGLLDYAQDMSDKLICNGVASQDQVAIVMENGLDFMAAFYAILIIGAVPVPINPALKENELRYIVNDAQIKTVVSRNVYFERLKSIIQEAPRTLGDNTIIYKTDIEIASCEKAIEDTALILYTSGSTGNAKGVMLTNENLMAEMNNIREAHELGKDDRVLCVLPWFHINGLVITMLTPLLVGHEMYIADKFSVSHFWKWVEKYKITWFSGVPTIYSYLLSADNKGDTDISSLRFARSASASLPVNVLKTFEEQYGITIIESYGITEGGSQLTSNPILKGKQKQGSVGLPYGLKMIIVDDELHEVQVGETGEVCFKGKSITKGYYRKEKETKESLKDGWLLTGDLGKVDSEGYLYLSGRKKELINRAGEKFSPREIDEVIYSIPGVELAAAVGVPDEVYGEEVVAFIKKKPDADFNEQNVIDYCSSRMAEFKVPKEIYFVDEFPQGGNGKIQRLKFVAKYIEMKESAKNEK